MSFIYLYQLFTEKLFILTKVHIDYKIKMHLIEHTMEEYLKKNKEMSTNERFNG